MPYLIDFTALALVYLICIYRRRKVSGLSLAANSVMYAYLCGVLYFTLMPVIVSLPYCLSHPYVPMNMQPFRDVIMHYGDYERQIILNIIMTVPFGFLLPMCRRISGKKTGFLLCVLCTAALSLAIELLQPLICCRSSDITDLITNTVGGAVGYLLYLPFKRKKDV